MEHSGLFLLVAHRLGALLYGAALVWLLALTAGMLACALSGAWRSYARANWRAGLKAFRREHENMAADAALEGRALLKVPRS